MAVDLSVLEDSEVLRRDMDDNGTLSLNHRIYNMEQLMAVFVNIAQSLQTSADNMNRPRMPMARIQLKDLDTYDGSNPEKLDAFMTTLSCMVLLSIGLHPTYSIMIRHTHLFG